MKPLYAFVINPCEEQRKRKHVLYQRRICRNIPGDSTRWNTVSCYAVSVLLEQLGCRVLGTYECVVTRVPRLHWILHFFVFRASTAGGPDSGRD
jgi:hypothetical protein